jgi:hypothetical protein
MTRTKPFCDKIKLFNPRQKTVVVFMLVPSVGLLKFMFSVADGACRIYFLFYPLMRLMVNSSIVDSNKCNAMSRQSK